MEDMSLNDAWNLIGEACYAHKNKRVRYALMLVRADVAEKNIEIANKPLDSGEKPPQLS